MRLNRKLLTGGFVTAITCGLVGSITGTFAWFQYSTRATAELTGTTFGKAANLQLGIVQTENENHEYEDIPGLEQDANSSNHIYWAPKGGGMTQKVIEDYLISKGHTRDKVMPTTSGAYTSKGAANPKYNPNELISESNYPFLVKNDDIIPTEMPIYQIDNKDVIKSHYAVIPLALRVLDLKNDTYMKNESIYVSDVDFAISNANGVFELDNTNNLSKAFRIDFKTWNDDEEKANREILSPGRDGDGEIEIGGLLDINTDGYVDVDDKDFSWNRRSEMLYGAVKGSENKVYKNVLYDGYASMNQEDLGKLVKIDGEDELRDVSQYTGETYDSKYVYEDNPNYNPNDNGSKHLIYKIDEFTENTVVWSKAFVDNPMFGDNKKDCLENPEDYYYVLNDQNNVVSLEKAEGKIKDFILVREGDSYKLVKQEGSGVIDENYETFVYVRNVADTAYVKDGNSQSVTIANPFLGELTDFENNLYVLDSTVSGGIKVINNSKPLKDNFIIENVGTNSAISYTLGEISVTSKKFDRLYKAEGSDFVVKTSNEKGIYEADDDRTGYTPKVHLAGTSFEERKHQYNTYTVESYEAYKQKFVCLNSFESSFDSKGFLQGDGHVVCNTGEGAIAYCKLTMWIEGWDENCDLNIMGITYGVGVQFQIDRLDK